MHVPSGWNLTDLTGREYLSNEWKILFWLTSNNFTVLSKLDEHINLESGENLAELIMSWWLFKTNKGFWLSSEVTLIRLSSAPDKINLLSYEISTDLIGASWRRRVCEVPSLLD